MTLRNALLVPRNANIGSLLLAVPHDAPGRSWTLQLSWMLQLLFLAQQNAHAMLLDVATACSRATERSSNATIRGNCCSWHYNAPATLADVSNSSTNRFEYWLGVAFGQFIGAGGGGI